MEVHDDAAVEEPVEEPVELAGRDHLVAQDIAPAADPAVGREDAAGLEVAMADDLEQRGGGGQREVAPIPPDKYSKMFRALTETAHLRRIRLHDVRHTALTLMALNGVPLAVVAAWAGHADPAFTLRVYAHSQDDAIRDASSLLTRIISESL